MNLGFCCMNAQNFEYWNREKSEERTFCKTILTTDENVTMSGFMSGALKRMKAPLFPICIKITIWVSPKLAFIIKKKKQHCAEIMELLQSQKSSLIPNKAYMHTIKRWETTYLYYCITERLKR